MAKLQTEIGLSDKEWATLADSIAYAPRNSHLSDYHPSDLEILTAWLLAGNLSDARGFSDFGALTVLHVSAKCCPRAVFLKTRAYLREIGGCPA